MRRPDVLPHRSVRSIRLTAPRLVFTVLAAGTISAAVLSLGGNLLEFHTSLCRAILAMAGIPAAGSSVERILSWAFAVPVIDIPPFASSGATSLVSGGLVFAALLILHWRFPMARSFLFVIMAAIVVAGLVEVFLPSFRIGSEAFMGLWLRNQFVLWVLLPWVGAFLVLPVDPLPFRGVALILLLVVYGLAWSAVRLAFCLGVMHYTGVVFLTTLWFGVGPLSDLLYILVFYSLVIGQVSASVWGRRQ